MVDQKLSQAEIFLETFSVDHIKSIPDFSCPGGVVSVEVRGGELEFGGGDGSLGKMMMKIFELYEIQKRKFARNLPGA